MSNGLSNLTGNLVLLKDEVVTLLPDLIAAIILLISGWIVIKFIKRAVKKLFLKTKLDETIELFILRAVNIILWVVLLTTVLMVLGVDVSALLASFGVMGFIVGFALKDTLSNLAAGVFILFYKPFKVNHWVKLNDQIGKVTEIGIASTVLKTRNNVRVNIPNSKVWGNPIMNFTVLRKLRLTLVDESVMEVCVKKAKDVEKALKVIKNVLQKDDRIIKDKSLDVFISRFDRFGTYIIVKPMVKITDFWQLRDELPLTIHMALVKKGISFD